MDNVVLWRSVLSSLEERISRPSFVTWFRNTTVRTVKDNEIILSVPNIFVREWLQTKFDKDLLSSFQRFSPEIKKIKYVISREGVSHNEKGKTRVIKNDLAQPKIDFYQNRLSGLNPRYSFSNFVVGNFNQLAHACAFSVSKKMIESSRKTIEQKRKLQLEYNPLFVYSKVGLGKTHLLESIGNEVVNSGKKKKVKYVPCPNFTSDVISAIRGGSIEKLIKVYNQFDVLIIDDIEFIAGKERTQEVFFRIFNNLKEDGRQIILSSDRSPRAIEHIGERLRSRFEGGMVTDISSPDFEERSAILEQKLEEKDVFLPKELSEFIAKHVKNNIRELEGILIKALVIFERSASVERVENDLKNIIEEPKKRVSPSKIIETVCDFYNVSKKEILSKSRKHELVLPRQIMMYFLRKELGLSLSSIGVKLGDKDHTTVGYACEKIEDKLKKDGDLIQEIEALKEKVYSKQ